MTDEAINRIISEYSNLAQREYKARHDWVGKVIHWEMCKKFKFDHTNKWYIHSPAPVLENDTHKLLWNFDMHMDHLISAKIIINKKKRFCKIVDFAVPKAVEHESAFGTITKGLLKGLEDLEVGGRVETIQMTALLRTARILRRVLET